MRLRLATADDADFLYRLRNDPTTRAMSRTAHEISAEEHVDWLKTTTDRILIAVNGLDARLGSIRFVRHPHELELGIVVAPEHRGQGHAAEMLKLAVKEAWAPVVAYVREDNERSLKAFERAGFKREDTYIRFSCGGA